MSYRELEAFKKKVSSINASIAKLEEKKAEQIAKRAKAGQEREAMLISEAVDGVEADPKKLGALRKTMDDCEVEIAEIEERIVLIEQKRAEALASELPAIKKGRDREIESLSREAAAQFTDARKLMFEYLLALQKVGLTRDAANKLHQDFVYHAKMVDPDEYGRTHWNRGSDAIPMPVLFYDDAGIKLGIREGDQKAALNGNIEPTVMLYQLTGEIESSNNVASAKLRKAAR